MIKDLLQLPPEIVYYILGFLDKYSLLKFGEINKIAWNIIQNNLLRKTLKVFPYRAAIPDSIVIFTEHDQDPAIGHIICVERPGITLCSLDIPCVVVYNNPRYHYLGVIFPRITFDIDSSQAVVFGECRIESGTYLHKEHFRLARSSKLLIKTMREEIISKLNLNQDPQEMYYVCRVNKYDIKNSGRNLSNMKENLKMGLTLSDRVILNPVFNFSDSVDNLAEPR